jgi:hypothetical protein
MGHKDFNVDFNKERKKPQVPASGTLPYGEF